MLESFMIHYPNNIAWISNNMKNTYLFVLLGPFAVNKYKHSTTFWLTNILKNIHVNVIILFFLSTNNWHVTVFLSLSLCIFCTCDHVNWLFGHRNSYFDYIFSSTMLAIPWNFKTINNALQFLQYFLFWAFCDQCVKRVVETQRS